MAYRPLVKGDKVKVKALPFNHAYHCYRNMFGEVVYVSGSHVSVAIGSNALAFRENELMVAHDDLSGSIYRYRQSFDDFEKEECPYDDWSKTDLIDKINQLERQIEELES
jgi:hypothetical protein